MSVGSYHSPSSRQRRPPGEDPVALGAGALDKPLDAREVVGVDEGRDGRRGVAAVAQHVGPGALDEPVPELVVDRRLDEQSGPGEADLSGVVVHHRGPLYREVEVGVGEDDEGALAAELGREGHEVRGRGEADRPARLG